MPDYVVVRIKPLCDTKTFQKIVSSITTNNEIDFQKIIPLDEDLANFDPGSDVLVRTKTALNIPLGYQHNCHIDHSKIISTDEMDKIIQTIRMYQKTGYCCSHDARKKKWGTMDNCCYSVLYDDQFEFRLSWTPPKKILSKLSSMYQDIVFEVSYACADLGKNCGKLQFLNGTIIDSHISKPKSNTPEERREWGIFAFNLCREKGETVRDFGFDENFNFIGFR